EHRLAVAGRAIQKHRLARIHRGAELLQHVVADDEVRERRLQPAAIEEAARFRELARVVNVDSQRNGRGTAILTGREILLRAIAAKVRQRKSVRRGAGARHAAHFDQPLGARALEHRLDHLKRQTHPIRDGETGHLAAVQRLHHQHLDLIGREARLLERRRRGKRSDGNGNRDAHQCVCCASGNSTLTNLMAAGPMVTTQIAGKMQKTSGNTILTPVLAAASSARWRRLVRSVSEWTRSDWATLVPNLSVWISIATSEMTSSTPVRSPRFLNASTRFIPPR